MSDGIASSDMKSSKIASPTEFELLTRNSQSPKSPGYKKVRDVTGKVEILVKLKGGSD